MIIFPAIDIIGGSAVRLTQGDYKQVTRYSDNPLSVARGFAACGAEYLHVVDLEGARDGTTPNFNVVNELAEKSGLMIEIGGGIRNMETVRRYFNAGVARVILGTAALNDNEFLLEAVEEFGGKIVVGVDLRDGYVAVKGWTETSMVRGTDFITDLAENGVRSVICTDISKDGALSGTNEQLYTELSDDFPDMRITASGGISDLKTIKTLSELGLYGAIFGKAIYTGDISLADAIATAKDAK